MIQSSVLDPDDNFASALDYKLNAKQRSNSDKMSQQEELKRQDSRGSNTNNPIDFNSRKFETDDID